MLVWWTMEWGSWHCRGERDQDHPHGKEIQKSKMLDYKESWVPKNWCFLTVVLEKTLERPLDCNEIQPVHSKADQRWVFIGRTDVEAETPVFWPPDVKSWPIGEDSTAGKDWGQEKGVTKNEIVGWHHWINGNEFEQIPGDTGQESLACWSSWDLKELGMP